jgi:hypothetical protein
MIRGGMQGEEPENPALAQMIEELDFGHGGNGGGIEPGTVAALGPTGACAIKTTGRLESVETSWV